MIQVVSEMLGKGKCVDRVEGLHEFRPLVVQYGEREYVLY